MNYQNQNMTNPRTYACACVEKAIAFLAGLLALALGMILGITLSAQLTPVLATVIIFAVVMLVGIIALLIYRYCLCPRCGRCE